MDKTIIFMENPLVSIEPALRAAVPRHLPLDVWQRVGVHMAGLNRVVISRLEEGVGLVKVLRPDRTEPHGD